MTQTEQQRDPEPLPDHVAKRLSAVWNRAYKAKGQSDLIELYDDWAASYDEDHEAIGFFGHRRAAKILARYTPFPRTAQILDAGAGTGAAGIELARLGYTNLTAIDLSASMLEKAAEKSVYDSLHRVDLGRPLDLFPSHHFDAVILVGVFSFGQAPAHTLEEMTRVAKPGAVIVFTMRTDFFEQDAMGVRSVMEELERTHAWKQLTVTEPEQYLPKKDPSAMFRVWCYRVLENANPPVDEHFAEAVRAAFAPGAEVRRFDHRFIWNTAASRLYDEYTTTPGYYLTDVEIEILRERAAEILNHRDYVVELGCGSARKIGEILAASLTDNPDRRLTYAPIDLSEGAVRATCDEIEERFGDRVELEPHHGNFTDALSILPVERSKLLLFFGGSIGNFETLEETVAFLRSIRERMSGEDRFVVGIDLHKEESILRDAYEAGPENEAFFLNIVRRMNQELGANFDLTAFRQDSPYLPDHPYEGLETRAVHFRLRSERDQTAYISALHMEASLEAGDAVQVGLSRKFPLGQIPRLGELAGLELEGHWEDNRGYFSLCRFARADDDRG